MYYTPKRDTTVRREKNEMSNIKSVTKTSKDNIYNRLQRRNYINHMENQ